jgi:hypothetical protein
MGAEVGFRGERRTRGADLAVRRGVAEPDRLGDDLPESDDEDSSTSAVEPRRSRVRS